MIVHTTRSLRVAALAGAFLAAFYGCSQAKPLMEKIDSIAEERNETSIVVGQKADDAEVELHQRLRLSEWWSDNGSGGFADNYSDENYRVDEWERALPSP